MGGTLCFNGASSTPWLAGNGSVKVVVDRIPEQAQLSAPQVMFNQTVNVSGGAVTVPLTFQSSHDACAIYLTPTTTSSASPPVSVSPPVSSSPVPAG